MVMALNQFLCGISLKTGTMFILFLNTLLNIMLIVAAVFNVVIPLPLFKLNFQAEIVIVLGFLGLMGMPFVLGGFWGCYMKSEPNVRVYLAYLWVIFACLIIVPAIFLAVKNPCHLFLPASMQGAKGSAQSCGNMWVAIYGVGALVASVVLYLIFTVWSYCQELAIGGGQYGLPLLVEGKKRKDARGVSSGLFGTGAVTLQPSMPVNYASCATMGMGGCNKFFNGKFHEADFPPPKTGGW
jgi:hypothetical protein